MNILSQRTKSALDSLLLIFARGMVLLERLMPWVRILNYFSHNMQGDAKLYSKSSEWQTGEEILTIFQRFYYGRLPCDGFINGKRY